MANRIYGTDTYHLQNIRQEIAYNLMQQTRKKQSTITFNKKGNLY